MNILEEIIKSKKIELKERARITPIERIKDSHRLYSVRDFIKPLKNKKIQIIAEIKKRSPAAGNINIKADPAKIAQAYATNGAAAISVVTDQHYFGGQLEFIQQVKAVVELPILRKDFIISEYQVWESFHAGADAILLIADVLELPLLTDLHQLAVELGLHVIIEVHNTDKIHMMHSLNPAIIGVNCRDLTNMKTDIKWFANIIQDLPKKAIWVAESGIASYLDIEYVSQLGFNAVLVGTSIMKEKNPGLALSKLCIKVTA